MMPRPWCDRSTHPSYLRSSILSTSVSSSSLARELFTRLLLRCNDVGLLAEEFDPLTGRILGNFPQAYSHVGLINCALSLSRQKGPAEERAESQGTPTVVA